MVAAKVEWDGEELHGRLVFLGKTCTTSTNIDIAIIKSLFHIKLLGQLMLLAYSRGYLEKSRLNHITN